MMRFVRLLVVVWMLGVPACTAERVMSPSPAEARFRVATLDSPDDSTVRVFKAQLGAGSRPAALYIIDGVPYGPETLDSVGLDSLDIVSVEVLKPVSHGRHLPHLTSSVVIITTRSGTAASRRRPRK
jgi:hypothetical protein